MSLTNHIGQSTTYTSILPSIGRIYGKKLSREAKWRLGILDFHFLKSGRNVSLTSRRFGVSRAFIYKWLTRYNPKDLGSLEDRSRRPHHFRDVKYDQKIVGIIRKLRTDFPTYSSKRLHIILERDWGILVSAATIGRIIKRYALYFARKIRLATIFRSKRILRNKLLRKPHELKATSPHSLIEFDMKHIRVGNRKQYAFCAVDPYTKEAVIHIAATPSSNNARIAIEKVIATFGKDIQVLNDNGSENFGETYRYLDEHSITQYFTRPHTPKDKPHIENLIGKLQQECLDEDDRVEKTVVERQTQINDWLNVYHFFRPHQALNYLTPAEHCATLGITIERRELSTMC